MAEGYEKLFNSIKPLCAGYIEATHLLPHMSFIRRKLIIILFAINSVDIIPCLIRLTHRIFAYVRLSTSCLVTFKMYRACIEHFPFLVR
uniref:Uncharacterized protein n=1 Tax=Octopus bimaculoides TaxID=37653 RepID=A0A0L8G704_OCTBM